MGQYWAPSLRIRQSPRLRLATPCLTLLIFLKALPLRFPVFQVLFHTLSSLSIAFAIAASSSCVDIALTKPSSKWRICVGRRGLSILAAAMVVDVGARSCVRVGAPTIVYRLATNLGQGRSCARILFLGLDVRHLPSCSMVSSGLSS